MMEILLDVVSVEVRPGHVLHLEFENGEKRLFDMSGYMDKKPFSQLKGTPRFEMRIPVIVNTESADRERGSEQVCWELEVLPQVFTISQVFRCLRMESPVSSRRWLAWTTRSRMASASVGSLR